MSQKGLLRVESFFPILSTPFPPKCLAFALHVPRAPLMPQVPSSPVFGGSGAPCQGPEDAGGRWDVPGDEKPAGPHPEEELLRR